MKDAPENVVATVPDVTPAGIAKAECCLGVRFDTPRRDVLLSNASFDVQACPGSGKTTLLVAKLAILAEKWPHARRGICVLSHTNVARREIEARLGGTAAGQRLLAYPHFVGTIHGFANEFLALPLLRSEERPVRMVDDDACFEWMKARLMSWPTRRRLGNLPFRERAFHSLIWSLVGGGVSQLKRPNGITDDQWAALVETKSRSLDKGMCFHADMFAAAERLLDQHSGVGELASYRFPVVFIDEMQDTSEMQARLLAQVFPAGVCAMRQRFGDSNQAIFDHQGQNAATTDPFPADGYRSLPNSQRFGMTIACKAEPLAPVPPQPSLVGEGPGAGRILAHIDTASMPHTLFLFTADSVQQVLPAFGALLLSAFPDDVLRSSRFLARAIGRVGKPGTDDSKTPKHLGDYWTGYEPQAAKLEPRPQTLADYVHLAQRRRVGTPDCAESVRTVAKGVGELVARVTPAAAPVGGQACRWLSESVAEDAPAARLLRNLLWQWCIEPGGLQEDDWDGQVEWLRRAIHPITGGDWSQDADGFCQWSAEFAGKGSTADPTERATPNLYRHEEGGRSVDIEVGTIHSAKGQTHTATLVLETFSWDHDMEDLSAWLLGQKRGAQGKEGVRRLERLRLIYTAMTRPSHLLCLAMRQCALGGGVELDGNVKRLESLGWRIQIV